ncbi:MAG TPA: hypothetical protein VL484_18650 [Vicinamibacterales bacterium]|nr:hypothetical protein [Vicinamibacterales bacterium]
MKKIASLRGWYPSVIVLACLLCTAAASARSKSDSIVIGAIDFFGTSGVDLAGVRAALPFKSGDALNEADFDLLKIRINPVVTAHTGKPVTDVSGVCCDDQHRLLLYIGLAGRNSRAVRREKPPKGKSCLEQAARDLYGQAIDAMQKAIDAGETAEDHSQGYALSENAGFRARQLAMRDYAVGHEPLLETALSGCRVPEDRQAAAHLLGYADQSHASIQALVEASHDSDATVRNNAIRALWVLAASGQPAGRWIPASPFVAMLNSATWEDRNKAGLLLSALTERKDPALLRDLRREAMESLVEMARWHEASHAMPYRFLLGRIGGIDEERLGHLVADGKVEEIVAAATGPAK